MSAMDQYKDYATKNGTKTTKSIQKKAVEGTMQRTGWRGIELKTYTMLISKLNTDLVGVSSTTKQGIT